MNFFYFPILKSRTSELKAYENLSSRVKQNILPIVELTKSRISKNNENGSIEKKIEEIKKIFDNNLFILDLTTENTLKNPQIDEMLLSYTNGYDKWTEFVEKLSKSFKIIPCIHYNPNHIKEVKLQIEKLQKVTQGFPLALRLDAKNIKNPIYIEEIKNFTRDCILILDGGYSETQLDFNLKDINEYNFKAIICAYSSFPNTLPQGENIIKEYKLNEQKNFFLLKEKYSNIFYGDYACTHPLRYDTQARGWIPRIDIPLMREDILYYYRCRTSEKIKTEQAYQQCAKFLLESDKIDVIDNSIWGFRVLSDAKNGYVAGKSPSFWIAVRINIYISTIFEKMRNEEPLIL